MQNKKKKYRVCKLDDLNESGSYAWSGMVNDELIQCVLILHQGNVYSYLNRCPHTGVNLDWLTNQFLDNNNEYIQCATHGALFNIEDGYCLRGPCVGDRLQIIDNQLIKGHIYLIL